MVVKRTSLGRNLSALLHQPHLTTPPSDNIIGDEPTSRVIALSVLELKPGSYQPRRHIPEDTLLELAQSIKQHGVLQPIIVRALAPNQYEIIAGERRWRACQLIQQLSIPAIVRDVDDKTAMALALIENLQRHDLTAIEEAMAMQRLIQECSFTHQQVADTLCKSRTAVTNTLRLLQLTPTVKTRLAQGELAMGHARCLLMLDDEQQIAAAEMIVLNDLSVRETEALVTRLNTASAPPSPKPSTINPIVDHQIQTLSQKLDAKIKLKPGSNGRGTLIIHYDGEQHLTQLMNQFMS